MLPNIKSTRTALLVAGTAIGIIISATVGHQAHAQDQAKNNLSLGRTPVAIVDEYVLPPDVSEAYKKAPRSDEKHPGEFITSGKWKGYTPPPMPKKP
jgi:hypothetical protein